MPKLIRKRGKDTYQLAVSAGYDANGKQRIITRTIKAKNYREAQQALIMLKADIQKHSTVYMDTQTVTQFAYFWFDTYCLKELSPKTCQSYKNQLENRIIPLLGDMQIGKIKPIDVARFARHIQTEGKRFDGKSKPLSAQVIRYCIRTLSSMLQYAFRLGLIEQNPAKDAVRIKVPRKRMRLPDEMEIAKLLEALQQEPLKYRLIVILALDSGLRRGEIMALEWSAVRLDIGSIMVRQSNIAIPGRGIITKLPKNDMSMRVVNISGITLHLLKLYKQWQDHQKELLGNKWQHDPKHDWVFTQWNGLPMYPETPSHWFEKFLKRHHLFRFPFHGLRHLTATILIAQNTPLKNISTRLGHSDIRTTANIYSESLQSVDRVAAEKMNGFLEETLHKEQ